MLLCVLFAINTFPPLNSSRSNRKLLSGVIWNEQPESINHSSLEYWVLTVRIKGSLDSATTLAESGVLNFFLSGHSRFQRPLLTTYKTPFGIFVVSGT